RKIYAFAPLMSMLATRKETKMKTLKWMVPILVVLCMALCLSVAKSPRNTKASVPPGIIEADWHSISDDFGYVLRITKRPLAQSILQWKKNRSIPENPTDEEKRLLEEIQKQQENQIAELMAIPKNNVGEALVMFFARKGKTWYVVTTPPPAIEPHLIQR
ncbi:MAG: hypothetical protein JSW47_18015, partial [Phycisphaerales bacterium]